MIAVHAFTSIGFVHLLMSVHILLLELVVEWLSKLGDSIILIFYMEWKYCSKELALSETRSKEVPMLAPY